MTYLIIGLGNPEPKYTYTRHNAGFIAIDFLLNELLPNTDLKTDKKHNALTYKSYVSDFDEDIVFAKPITYMNLSGKSVQSLATFYKIHPDNIIILHDELDFPNGQVKTKFAGSPAGHNGLKSIDNAIGKNYHRIRIGIDHPRCKTESNQNQIPVADYVLQNFAKEELNQIIKSLPQIIDMIKVIIKDNKKNK